MKYSELTLKVSNIDDKWVLAEALFDDKFLACCIAENAEEAQQSLIDNLSKSPTIWTYLFPN